MPGVTALDEIVTSVFGDLVDLEEVAKMGPDPSGVHVPGHLQAVRLKSKQRRVVKREPLTPEQRRARQETERKIAQVSNVVGLTAGTAGTYSAAQNYRDVKRGGEPGKMTQLATRKLKLKSKTAARLGVIGAGSALGLQAGNVAGDVITARVLGRKEPASKSLPLRAVRAGRKKSVERVLVGMVQPVGKRGEAMAAAVARGKQPGSAYYQWSREGRRTASAARLSPGAAPLPKRPQTFGAWKQGDAPATPKVAVVPKQREGMSNGVKAAIGGAAGLGLYQAGKAKGTEQAYYGKAEVHDVEIGGTFSKFDTEKRRAYGWASVVSMDGEPVVDRQGDYIGLDDIEEAAYTYVRKSRVTGDMHRRTTTLDGQDAPHKAGELIESVVFTPDKCHAMGLPASFAGKWWMGVQVEDDQVWDEVKKGRRTGFSIHGKGLRKDTTYDEIRSS